MSKALVLVSLLVVVCTAVPANAQEGWPISFWGYGSLEDAILGTTIGIAGFGVGMGIYNWHRLHEDSPNKIAGYVGIASSVMSFVWGTALVSWDWPDTGPTIAGGAFFALGGLTAYYSIKNITQPGKAHAENQRPGATFGPTVICNKGQPVVLGMQLRLTF